MLRLATAACLVAAASAAPPVITAGGFYPVVNTASAGTVLGPIVASDADGDALTYTLLQGQGLALQSGTGVLSLMKPANMLGGVTVPLVVEVSDGTTSIQASFTVVVMTAAAISTPGMLLERYTNCGGDVSSLEHCTDYINRTPNFSNVTVQPLDFSGVGLDWFAHVYTGFLVPNVTGNHTFWCVADDVCQVRIGSTALPSSLPATPVTARTSYAPRYEWSSANPGTVFLVAGQWYWFETMFMDMTGGDSLSVAWRPPGAAAPVQGSASAVVPVSHFRPPTALPDWTPPSAPTHVAVEAVTSSGVQVMWMQVADADVASYMIYRDGTLLATVAKPTRATMPGKYLDPITTGTHTYTVIAVDTSGNASPASSALTVNAAVPYDAVEEAAATGNAVHLLDPLTVADRVLTTLANTDAAITALYEKVFPAASPIAVSCEC